MTASALVGVVAVHAQSAKPNAAAIGPVKPRSADAPQIGDFGFDIAGMDRSRSHRATISMTMPVAPGAKDTAIPADKSSFGAFDVLADLSRTRTHDILEAQKATGSKIGTAYAAFLDTGAIDAKGLAPIKPWMAQIAALTDKAGYPALLAKADRMGIRGPFGGGVGQDAKQPSIYALGLRQAGTGLARSRLLSGCEVRAAKGGVSGAYRQDVRTGGRTRCRCACQGAGRLRDRHRDRKLDPRARAATRTRPTTR